MVMLKTDAEIFVFPNMTTQARPNIANRRCIVVPADTVLDNYTYSDGGLIEIPPGPTPEEEEAARIARLDAQWKERRKLALMSFELTIFPDSTLTEEQKQAVMQARQEWYDMTDAAGYPDDFVPPVVYLGS